MAPVKPIRHVHALENWVGFAATGQRKRRQRSRLTELKSRCWDSCAVHFQLSLVRRYVGSIQPGDISAAATDREDGLFDERGEGARIAGSLSSYKHPRGANLKQPRGRFNSWMMVP